MRILGLLVVVALCMAQSPSNFQPVGTMSQLMIDIIYPASDALFYIERTPLKIDADWAPIRESALMVAESGNLLLIDGRARDQEKWVRDAKLMIDVGQKAYQAARKKDMQAILDLSEQLSNSCIVCHRDYRPNYGK